MEADWHPDADELVANTQFLRRLARRLVTDEAAADDLVQDTMLAALTAPRQPRESLRQWLVGVARNLARMKHRSASRRQRRERGAEPPRPLADPADVMQRLELEERVVRGLRELPEPYGTTLVLRFRDELDTPTIARLTDVAESTVRTRVKRGLALLRERLDDDVGRAHWTAGLLPLLIPAPHSHSIVATGAVLTMKKTMTLVALALVALLTVWGWTAWRDSDPDTRSRTSRNLATAPAARERATVNDAGLPGQALAPADRDLDLFGVVVDPDGNPIEGALVGSVQRPWYRAHVLLPEKRPAVPGPKTRTAQDGAFRLRLRRGALVDLSVEAEGYATVTVPRCQAGERVRVELAPGATLTVRVRDAAGDPVVHAALRLLRPRAGREPVFTAQGQTGADGACVLTGVPPGRALLRVGDLVEVACEVPGSIDVDLPELRTIAGVVRDAETGAPIEGARVGADWDMDGPVPTDDNGRFAWSGANARELHVDADGYGRARKLVPPTGPVEFELTRGDVAEGRIVDRAGRPVAGAYLVAMASQHTNSGQELDTRTARSAADGTFVVEALRHDLPHTLIVHAEGHAKHLVDIAPASDGPGRILLGDVPLPESRSLEGKVVTVDGTPVVACTVVIQSTEAHFLDSYYGAREERRTDDLGRFRFPDLAAGTYSLEARVPNREPVRVEATIPEGRDLVDVVLIVKDGRFLNVTLQGADGLPAPGIHIAVDGQERRDSRTNAEGRAVLHELPEGELTLRFWPGVAGADDERGWLAGEAQVAAGEHEVRATLKVTRPIRGTVISAGDEPLAAMIVQALRADGEPLAETLTDQRGRFTMFVPSATPVDVLVDGGRRTGGRFGPLAMLDVMGVAQGVTAPANDLTIRTGAMPGDRSIAVEVVDRNGIGVRGLEVQASYAGAFPMSDPSALWATTDARGRAAFNGLPRRRLRIEVRPGSEMPSGVVAPEPLVLAPEGQTVQLALRPGAPYRFVATLPDGTPREGVVVALSTMAGVRMAVGTTDAEGRVTLYGVLDTVHQIYAAYEGGDGVRREVYVHELRFSDEAIPIRFKN